MPRFNKRCLLAAKNGCREPRGLDDASESLHRCNREKRNLITDTRDKQKHCFAKKHWLGKSSSTGYHEIDEKINLGTTCIEFRRVSVEIAMGWNDPRVFWFFFFFFGIENRGFLSEVSSNRDFSSRNLEIDDLRIKNFLIDISVYPKFNIFYNIRYSNIPNCKSKSRTSSIIVIFTHFVRTKIFSQKKYYTKIFNFQLTICNSRRTLARFIRWENLSYLFVKK